MPILQKFTKRPGDKQDYDVLFVDWLAALSDTAASVSAEADPGITLLSAAVNEGVVKVWTMGGQDGASYKITITLTTAGGRIKQTEIVIRVKKS